MSETAPSGAPLLQRRLPAALAMLASLLLSWLVVGRLSLLFPTLVAWAVCLVGLARAVTGRRRLVALLYALGAAPVTVVLALFAFG